MTLLCRGLDSTRQGSSNKYVSLNKMPCRSVPDGNNAGRRGAKPGRDVMSWHHCRGGFLRGEHEGMLRGIALPDAVAALQQRAVRGSFLLPENKINLPLLSRIRIFPSRVQDQNGTGSRIRK